MTYGQVDLQQHCLAFIEGCTTVRPQVMGEHGVGGTGQGSPRTECLEAGRGANDTWREDAVTGRGRLGATAVPGDWSWGWGMLGGRAGMAAGCV